jgi:hypothetical protein
VAGTQFPEHCQVDVVIAVAEMIADVGNSPPGNVVVASLQFRRNMPRRFADDFDKPFEGGPGKLRSAKRTSSCSIASRM